MSQENCLKIFDFAINLSFIIWRKLDIILPLNTFVAHIAIALLGWCFLTYDAIVSHADSIPLISLEVGCIAKAVLSSSPDELFSISSCCDNEWSFMCS